MTDFSVTSNSRHLQRADGYWSGKKVFFNPTSDKIVLLQQQSCSNLKEHIASLQKVITHQNLSSYFKPWVGKNYYGPVELEKTCQHNNTTWMSLNKLFDSYTIKEASQHLSKMWWNSHSSYPHEAIEIPKLHRLPTNLSPLLLNRSIFSTTDVEESIVNLSKISQLNYSIDSSKHPNSSTLPRNEKIKIVLRELTVQERELLQWIFPFLSLQTEERIYYHGIILARNAASAMLAWLRYNQILILPTRMKNMKVWLGHFPIWSTTFLTNKELKSLFSNELYDIIASSTTAHIDDIPDNIFQIYGLKNFPAKFFSQLAALLKHPYVERKKAVFPIDNLSVKKQLSKKASSWTPEWIADHLNSDWFHFADLFWQHPTIDSNKKSVLRNFVTIQHIFQPQPIP